MSKRRNVVFIMTDTQRYDMLGVNGSTFCRTPSLDQLAGGGMNFRCAYTTTPLCTPARAALFTGLYSTSAGAAANQIPLFENIRNTGQIYTDAGFNTAYIGKWHLDGPRGAYYGAGQAPDGFPQQWWYDGRQFQLDVGEAGFERWKNGQDLQPDQCWATRLADRAEKFIEQQSTTEKPFYLVVSFDEPHGPSSAPQKYYDMYRGTKRPRSANMDDMLDNKPAVHRAFEQYSQHRGRVPPGEDPNNSPKFYGCNTFVDHQIGRVVHAVDRFCPHNTVVVYTSDHGDHAGSHGLMAKGPTMYEETTHVPLIIRAPALTQPGSVCDQLISHIDLPATLCRLAGIDIPPQFQGRDATPLLTDPGQPIQDEIHLEYFRFGLPHHTRWGFQPIKCIRNKRYKLVLNLLDTDELYDLRDDPGETTNRIDDPNLAPVRDDLHDRLLAWMDRRLDPLRGNGWWQRPWRPQKTMPPRYDPQV